MSITGVAFLVACAVYTGFQWTIRVLVYPQFAAVGAADFGRYEQRHQRLVSIAVGPLFAGLGVSAVAVVVRSPAGAALVAVVLAPILVGLILVVTALLAVPLHRRLSAGFDVTVHRRLLAVDTVRLAAAIAATVDAVVLVAG